MDDRGTGNAVLANLCALNVWANLALIDACAELDVTQLDLAAPNVHMSLRHALWHLVEREHQFAAALNGESDPNQRALPGSPDGSLGTLRVHAIDSGESLTAWAEEVSGDPLLQRAWEGNPLSVPASILVGEALLQAASQRQQIQLMMYQLGAAPPDLSALTWWRTLRTVGSESATI